MPAPTFEEYLAITGTINKLFLATDNRDWPMIESLFVDKVAFDMTSLAGGEPKTLSPKEIVAGWNAGLKDLKTIHHQSGNFEHVNKYPVLIGFVVIPY